MFKTSKPVTTFSELVAHIFQDAYYTLRAVEDGARPVLNPNGPTGLAVATIRSSQYAGALDELRKHVEELGDDFTEYVIRMYPVAGVAKEGLKVWRPTAKECCALENVSVNIPWNMYSQPFETLTIILPDGYSLCTETPARRFFAVVIRYIQDCKLIVVKVASDDGDDITSWTCYAKQEENSLSIEDSIAEGLKSEARNLSSPETYAAYMRARRIAMNACLLLSRHTAHLSDANKPQRDKAQKKAADKSLPERIRDINARAALAVPEIYELDQKIKVYDEVKAAVPGDNGGEGSSKSPHWRRGHWANQPYGEGGKERKLIFKRPTFINAHLFEGELKDTTVSMTYAGGKH